MVSVKFNSTVKYRLIDIRQDPKYSELRSDMRSTIRYIEKLEKALERYKRRVPCI